VELTRFDKVDNDNFDVLQLRSNNSGETDAAKITSKTEVKKDMIYTFSYIAFCCNNIFGGTT
jgi:hypothetical protein